MQSDLGMCVYCERTVAELIALKLAWRPEDAIERVLINGQQIQLCMECRLQHAPQSRVLDEEFLDGPIEMPPGVTALTHCCPALLDMGLSDEEATTELMLQLDKDGKYYRVRCPHCLIEVRSLATD